MSYDSSARQTFSWNLILLAGLVLVPLVNAQKPTHEESEDDPLRLGNQKKNIRVGGSILSRYENWDWFGEHGNDYEFGFVRTRLNIEARWENLKVFLQPQFVKMMGLPDNAVRPSPKGPAGMGALYYAHNGEDDPQSIGFHQAYLSYSFPNDLVIPSVKMGRFSYASGLEYMNPADGKKLNTVKKLRLGDRMISSFEWSAFARSFDGIQLDLVHGDDFALTGTYMYPTQGGWEEDFNDTIHDIRINTLTATFPKGTILPGTEIGTFFYKYLDSRGCTQRIDNTCSAAPGHCNAADIDVQMFGGHIVGVQPISSGQWDYLIWGGIQNGDWYGLDHSAYGLAAETGYQWTEMFLKPWLRAGYYLGSGDSNPTDDDHETFFQMAPGTRKYQLFPYYDLQNSETKFIQLFLFPRKDLKLRLDYSVNKLSQDADRWYMGTGPTQQRGEIFGYLARPSGGDTDLSQEASVMAIYQPFENLSFNAFYSHVWGDDVIDNIYPGNDDADYFSISMTITF